MSKLGWVNFNELNFKECNRSNLFSIVIELFIGGKYNFYVFVFRFVI